MGEKNPKENSEQDKNGGQQQGKQSGIEAFTLPDNGNTSDPLSYRGSDMPWPFMIGFDVRMRDMEDEPLRGHAGFGGLGGPSIFDALMPFRSPRFATPSTFRENPDKNQVECEVAVGGGGFFRPEDVEMNLEGRTVELIAQREMECDGGYTRREIRRVLTVPETADIEKVEAEMLPNGRIMIKAPLLEPAEKKSSKPMEIKINRK